MSNNPLIDIQKFGQSIWLDYIRRSMLDTRELEGLIQNDGVRGVTVNPSILEKAIGGSHDYDDEIERLVNKDKKAAEIYENLAIQDVQRAADLFHHLYDQSRGKHGFVSLEISPYLAYDTEGTIQEARRFWNELDRPNVMIKVPATQEGLPAIQQLTAEGINVNVTLLFGLPRYRQVVQAYISGIKERLEKGQPVDGIASVASFFLSRIDVLVDPILERLMQEGNADSDLAEQIHGQVAVASAKLAYEIYREIFKGEDFQQLALQGARVQRLLWASTSTKNPAYSDVKYVEALIGDETVNTIPPETLHAYRDHGNPVARLGEDLRQAHQIFKSLPELDIDIEEISEQLEDVGVEKFQRSYDQIMKALEEKRATAQLGYPDRQWSYLGGYENTIKDRINHLDQSQFSSRLWQKDPSLWKGDPKHQKIIKNALGWLHVAEKMEENLRDLRDFTAQVKVDGFQQVVHIGMGGSSLAPMVIARSFTPGENGLPVTVLDSTDPDSILDIERKYPVENTLFIVASKSGTTAETRALADYFYYWTSTHKVSQIGNNFVAITDPGTPLVDLAQELGFRRTFLNFPDIGGRYSALSYVGLVPAALMDLDLEELLARALRMMHACGSSVPAHDNPGLTLGGMIGELTLKGRDKLTFLVPEVINTFGLWLEQLIAESTGKEGKGIIPVAGEPVGVPLVYGDDRTFVHFRLKDEEDETLNRLVEDLENAGHPVITILMNDRLDLGQEFFRWEIATATAGSILGIDAFNQPNVQESKDNTNRLLDQVREEGHLPEEPPDLVQDSLSIYAEETASDLPKTLALFFGQARPGDYLGLMAYLTENPTIDQEIQDIRLSLRNNLHLATTFGYGPRFLHSTGQLHKGGPNTGLYLQLTVDDRDHPQVRDQNYTFDVFKLAQAIGDLNALREHERRVIRIHLGRDIDGGLGTLKKAIEASLAIPYRAK